ncbi:MAG: hypothetical protein HPY53_01130 [Brevinematales bacterium]|nr:hypothetical protein [Brevinematales bacterium]
MKDRAIAEELLNLIKENIKTKYLDSNDVYYLTEELRNNKDNDLLIKSLYTLYPFLVYQENLNKIENDTALKEYIEKEGCDTTDPFSVFLHATVFYFDNKKSLYRQRIHDILKDSRFISEENLPQVIAAYIGKNCTLDELHFNDLESLCNFLEKTDKYMMSMRFKSKTFEKGVKDAPFMEKLLMLMSTFSKDTKDKE